MAPTNFIAGIAISWLVSGLKRIPIVCQYPKVTTAILSTLVPAGVVAYGQIKGIDVGPVTDLLAAAGTQFAAAIATHETVTHAINKVVFDTTKVEP